MSGLVAWWPLHRTSGDAVDLSGNGNDGTPNGGPTRGVWGRSGLQGTSFDGTDDFFTFDSSLQPEDPRTLSIWVRPANESSRGRIWSFRLDTQFVADINRTEGKFSVWVNGTWTELGGFNANQWTHIALTADGSGNWEFFIDGQSDSTFSATENPGSNNIEILGSEEGDNSVAYSGSMCDFRLYNRVLSASEIQTLYEWGSADYSVEPGIEDSAAVSRWAFDGDVTDSWGNNDGTDNTSAGFTSNAIRGQAKSFDGDDDWINISALQSLSQYTLSAWVKSDNPADGNTKTLLDSRQNNGILFSVSSGGNIQLLQDTGSGFLGPSYPIPADEWVHITGSWDGATITLYVNGVWWDSESISSNLSSGLGDFIGAQADNQNNTANNFDGDIDDVRIYSRALSSSEVFELYRWGSMGIDMRERTVKA
jgi:hypothetical protein